TVDRTTNGSGRVRDMLSADLLRLEAGRPGPSSEVRARLRALGVAEPSFGDRFAGENVPTLEQVLRLPGSRLMIEIKSDARAELVAQRVLEEIERAGAGDRVSIASFDRAILERAHALDPSIPLVGAAKTKRAIDGKLELPVHALAVRPALAKAALKKAPRGVEVWVYRVYTPEQAGYLARSGVHGIITDAPAQTLRLLRPQND
ncbi:MAG: hypothetical protein GTO30_21200, partial [Acidobacteria bacterium]|nr:hypothetical protein [Acidobacteriota bacterium]NIQ86451.1 hypothetical protein [Acidobacteriota bacterium]